MSHHVASMMPHPTFWATAMMTLSFVAACGDDSSTSDCRTLRSGETSCRSRTTSTGGSANLAGATSRGGTSAAGSVNAAGNLNAAGSVSAGGTLNAAGAPAAAGNANAAGNENAAGSPSAGGVPNAAGNANAAGAPSAGGVPSAAGAMSNGGSTSHAGSSSTAGAAAVLLPGPWNFATSIEDWTASAPGTITFDNTDPFCAASGCAKISGELSAGSVYRARIVLPQAYDLSGASIVVQIKWDSSTTLGYVQAYAQDNEPVATGDDNWANSVARGNGAALGAGATLNLDLPASKVSVATSLPSSTGTGSAQAGFNPAAVFVIGVVVGASSAGGTSTFFIDSVTITKP